MFFKICLLVVQLLLLSTFTVSLPESRDLQQQRFKRWGTIVPGRPTETHECKTDADCSNIPFTSCAQDAVDKKFKCLCADSSPPSANGDCKKKPKELRTPCSADYECLPGAECVRQPEDSKVKACYCQEGYVEVNNTCTSGCGFFSPIPLIVLSGMFVVYVLH